MADDMLERIFELRESADVTYEEAAQILRENNGDIVTSLVELEKQGRIRKADGGENAKMQNNNYCAQDTKEKVTSFFKEACKTRIVIEKRNVNGNKDTVLNLCAPVAAGIIILAPHLSLAAGVIALVTGHQFRVKKENA